MFIEEGTVKSSIEALFNARTTTNPFHLLYQQIVGVLIRRGQVFLRRARLLPIILILFLAYAFAPLYMPSFALSSSSSTEHIRYIVSSHPDFLNQLPLKTMDMKLSPVFNSAENFEHYLFRMYNYSKQNICIIFLLIGLRTWQSDYNHPKTLIGLRIPSSDYLECYVPSPFLYNIINHCLPLFTSFYNYTLIPFNLIPYGTKDQLLESLPQSTFFNDEFFYCSYSVPPRYHSSIVLLSHVLVICAALIIQDYTSGFHSYSLIHGLHSSLHWIIIFLCDLILCLVWLLILIVIARFVHASTFTGQFFALTPLFFFVNLPFIYLIAKPFQSPILGATVIVFVLLSAHVLYTFRVIVELFRGYKVFTTVIHILRWVLIAVFPNVNVFTLIVTILRSTYPCELAVIPEELLQFSHERYSHKLLIHILILIGQFLLYFILLILMDKWKFSMTGPCVKSHINEYDEDSDVAQERQRIKNMHDDNKQNESLIVNNISKYYSCSSIPAVNSLTFAVPHRQCFGLLGFNGSGKFIYINLY